MNARQIIRFVGVAAVAIVLTGIAHLAAGPAMSAPAPTPTPAASDSCPDVETLFARGTDEDPGLGPTGQAFVNALRSRIGTKSMRVYAVDYPASNDWPTAVDGVRDAKAHIESVAATCPKTTMVLSGFSQGAAVMGFVTANAVPDGVGDLNPPQPMAPEIADHVAAVVLFGTPNERAMNLLGQPQVVIGPLYAGKTIQLCAEEDPICSEGLNFSAHLTYPDEGIVDQGATYAANRLL